jgi:Putative addiction module component
MKAAIIEKEALQLSDSERAVLADRLLESLSPRPNGLDAAWIRKADSSWKWIGCGRTFGRDLPEIGQRRNSRGWMRSSERSGRI